MTKLLKRAVLQRRMGNHGGSWPDASWTVKRGRAHHGAALIVAVLRKCDKEK